jgi:hypothetical protein
MSTEVRLSTRDPAPEKIQARHCDRHAVVYVRQSTLCISRLKPPVISA